MGARLLMAGALLMFVATTAPAMDNSLPADFQESGVHERGILSGDSALIVTPNGIETTQALALQYLTSPATQCIWIPWYVKLLLLWAELQEKNGVNHKHRHVAPTDVTSSPFPPVAEPEKLRS